MTKVQPACTFTAALVKFDVELGDGIGWIVQQGVPGPSSQFARTCNSCDKHGQRTPRKGKKKKRGIPCSPAMREMAIGRPLPRAVKYHRLQQRSPTSQCESSGECMEFTIILVLISDWPLQVIQCRKGTSSLLHVPKSFNVNLIDSKSCCNVQMPCIPLCAVINSCHAQLLLHLSPCITRPLTSSPVK